MNKVILMGRLTRDPEIRYPKDASGTVVCRYCLAVDRRFQRDGEPEADFFNCTVFGKGAEFADKYLRKGTKVLVTGRMQQDNYTNREGQKVYSVQLIVEDQEFAESKRHEDGGNWNPSEPAPDGFMNIPDGVEEELPFH